MSKTHSERLSLNRKLFNMFRYCYSLLCYRFFTTNMDISMEKKPGTYREKGDGIGRKSAFVLALDIGTTTIRAHIYNQKAHLLTEASRKV